MKIVFGLLFCIVFSYGGGFDFFYTYKGESLQKEGKIEEALQYYKKVENKTDAVHYNMGNIYYKKKQYKEAIDSYEKVKGEALRYKKLHNLGNSYAQVNDLNKAKQSYEKALKIKKDKDTLYNLELLKKMEENKKNQENKNNAQKGEHNQTDEDRLQKGETEKNKEEKPLKNGQEKDGQVKDKITKEESDKRQAKVDEKVRKSNELSDLEEKKWSQMLESRDIKTLMIPMTKSGEKNDANIKPW